MLTQAAASVLAELEGADLTWQQISCPHKQASFQAVTAEGRLVSINALDGTLLLDGHPPSRLPRAILGHPLYMRTFGSVNFEVRCVYASSCVHSYFVHRRFLSWKVVGVSWVTMGALAWWSDQVFLGLSCPRQACSCYYTGQV